MTDVKNEVRLCAGVDVLKNRFEVCVWAFAAQGLCWPVTTIVLSFGPTGAPLWDELWQALNAPVAVPGGGDFALPLTAVAIDSGGCRANEVHQFVLENCGSVGPWVFAVSCSPRKTGLTLRMGLCDVNDNGRLRVDAISVCYTEIGAYLDILRSWFAAERPGHAPTYADAYAQVAAEWLRQVKDETALLQKVAAQQATRHELENAVVAAQNAVMAAKARLAEASLALVMGR